MSQHISVRVAAAVLAFASLTIGAAGCNLDVCQHHGGLKKAYVVSGTWYYKCNDGVTV